jgi:hypothetical protein
MYVNLHTLPPEQQMYTVYVGGTEPPGGYEWSEEEDVVASAGLTAAEVAKKVDLQNYAAGARYLGVVNQSSGYIMADWREDEKEQNNG